MSSKQSLQTYIEAVILAVVAVLLSLIPIKGTGIDIALGTIPISLLALRRGSKVGCLSGLLWGVLTLLFGLGSVIHPVQAILDYPLAFLCNGLCGLVFSPFQRALRENNKKRSFAYLSLGSFLGTLARYFWHYIAGVYYWGDFAPEGWSVHLYSFVFNGISVLITSAITIITLTLLLHRSPQLFKGESSQTE